MFIPQAPISLTRIAPLTAETALMTFPLLDSSNQFRLTEMHHILNAKTLAHLPDFFDANHSGPSTLSTPSYDYSILRA